jgi:SAM-dependent methyltransferase
MQDIVLKLDRSIYAMLRCPICKAVLMLKNNQFICNDCNSHYISQATKNGTVIDFRIKYADSLIPESTKKWLDIQQKYVEYDRQFAERDNIEEYKTEIDSVKEIYAEEFVLKGAILDVGGHQGRLRHFLSQENISIYISVDPYLEVFDTVDKPNLIAAYPCLKEQVNFISCFAENLPFSSNLFDYVHMRSVLDHFTNPYLAIKEAYRVLKPNGKILIGLTIPEKLKNIPLTTRKHIVNRLKTGIVPTIKSIFTHLRTMIQKEKDDHYFRFTHQELINLLKSCNFQIEKEHWVKPPYDYVLFISAKK